MAEQNQSTGSIVSVLPDGRLFVPDTVLAEAHELAQWLATDGTNYWQREWTLMGYVGPKENQHEQE